MRLFEAFTSIVPDVVDGKRILDTNNLLLGLGDIIGVIGPLAGVLIYSVAGFEAGALVTAVLFAVAFVAQWGV